MFCKNCGAEIDEKAFCCPKCGVLTNNESQSYSVGVQTKHDAPNGGFAVLSFFIPLIGLILWLTWKDVSPLKAKSCGKGALIGAIVSAVLFVINIVLAYLGFGIIMR